MATSRQKYHHGGLAAAMLTAASEIIEDEGLKALSVREAARRAGVSHNAPYRHFPHRDALLAALAAEGFAWLEKELAQHSGREIGAAYVRFALRHPERFRLMFNTRLQGAAGGAYQALVAAFAGQPGVAPPEIAAAAAWALMHGLADLLLGGHFEPAQRQYGGAESFSKKVLEAMRFAVGAQRSA